MLLFSQSSDFSPDAVRKIKAASWRSQGRLVASEEQPCVSLDSQADSFACLIVVDMAAKKNSLGERVCLSVAAAVKAQPQGQGDSGPSASF